MPAAVFFVSSLRGAVATKQSTLGFGDPWIASRSPSSGAQSRDPLARNDADTFRLRRLAVFGEVGKLAQDFGGAGQTFLRRLPFLEEHNLHVRPHPGRLAVLADEIDQAFRLRELVVAQRDHGPLRPRIDLLDLGAAAIALECGR